jgi:sugar/nucleoside kinase (ribokinase family)
VTAPVALACGLATVDVVQTVDHVPAPDEKLVALATRVEAGGPALNAAMTAAVLGMPCRLVSAVGPSPLGDVVRAECADAGVQLVDVAGDGFVVPVASVLVTAGTGERAVASGAVGDGATAEPLGAAELAVVLHGVAAVLVDGHHLPVSVPLAEAARAGGIPVVVDGGSWKPGLEALLAYADVLVASADFHAPAGDRLDDLLAVGPTWVARSAGAGPVEWRAADGSSGSVPVPEVDVVDTLGAGDVLHGALLADIARRGTADLRGRLTAAVAVATRSVGAPGARGWAADQRRWAPAERR